MSNNKVLAEKMSSHSFDFDFYQTKDELILVIIELTIKKLGILIKVLKILL